MWWISFIFGKLSEQTGIAIPAEAFGTDVLTLTEEQTGRLKTEGEDSWLKDLKKGSASIGIAFFFLLLHDYIFWSIMCGFKSLEIKNFRGIEQLTIDDLSRVNVFFGIWMRNIWRC